MKINRPFKFDISVGSDVEKDTKAVFELIKKTENDLLVNIDNLYEKLPNDVFKTFRKKIPCKNFIFFLNTL